MFLSLFGSAAAAALAYYVWTNRLYYFGGEDGRQKHFAQNYHGMPEDPRMSKMSDMKKKLFARLSSVESTFPEVRKRKGIKLLEIGAGKGANFPFYPPGTSVTVVDPNQHFKPFLEESVKKYPNVTLERCVPSGAEDMKAVPDNSVDVVVSTFAMCHVPDIQKVYSEIRRVLVPGGKYFFMEHVSDHKTSVTKIVQSIVGWLKNFRIVRILFGEGRPDKDVEREIVKAGFKSVEGERFRLDENVKQSIFTKKYWHMFLIAPQYCGVATTPK